MHRHPPQLKVCMTKKISRSNTAPKCNPGIKCCSPERLGFVFFRFMSSNDDTLHCQLQLRPGPMMFMAMLLLSTFKTKRNTHTHTHTPNRKWRYWGAWRSSPNSALLRWCACVSVWHTPTHTQVKTRQTGQTLFSQARSLFQLMCDVTMCVCGCGWWLFAKQSRYIFLSVHTFKVVVNGFNLSPIQIALKKKYTQNFLHCSTDFSFRLQ